jgi:parallel beta-helix repeat protein
MYSRSFTSRSGVAPTALPSLRGYALGLLAVLLVVVPGTGCSQAELDTDDLSAYNAEEVMRLAPQAHLMVQPGGSIQAAVDQARPGAVIHVRPGTYAEAVVIQKPNITLMGLRGPRGQGVEIVNPGGAVHGVQVLPGGDGVRIMQLTVRGFGRNGIFIRGVDGFTVMHVTAEDNEDYGIYPVLSTNGVISHCTASGHADAGIYIGQSTGVRILHSTTFENVIGIEISNAIDIETAHNTAYNNTVGILAALLPGRQTLREARRIVVAHNRVYDNNLPNFADHGLAQFVPVGSGILVLGIDDSVVEKNRVTGNDFIGIGLGSTLTLGAIAGLPPEAFADIEPDANGVIIRKNTVTGNGASPPPLPLPLPGVDLFWDTTGTGNCWDKNTYGTSFPGMLPACGPSV